MSLAHSFTKLTSWSSGFQCIAFLPHYIYQIAESLVNLGTDFNDKYCI